MADNFDIFSLMDLQRLEKNVPVVKKAKKIHKVSDTWGLIKITRCL